MPPVWKFRAPSGTITDISGYFRLYDWEVTSNAEEGSVATSQVTADDPAGAFDIVGHRLFTVQEDTATGSNTHIYVGYSAERIVKRGDYHRVGASRVWDISLVDINSVLSRRIFDLNNAKRPAETDVARVQWLLSVSESALIDDDRYLNTAGPVQMDAINYVGQTVEDLLNDCAQASGKNYFVWYAEDTGEYSLWYDFASSTSYSSPLRLSNVLSDIDDTWTFAISDDTQLRRDPSRVNSGVYLPYDGGAVYRQSDATANAFARRDAAMSSLNVKSSAKAEARAIRYLSDMSTEQDVITTTVILPAAKVNFLMQGMRVQFKASHLPPYEDFGWMRVLNRSVRQLSEEFYAVQMDLVAPASTVPASCLTTAALTQSSGIEYGNATNDISNPACMQVWVESVRVTPATVQPQDPVGFTQAEWAYVIGPGNNGTVQIDYRATVSGDTGAVISTNTGGDRAHILYEFSGINGFQSAASIDNQTSTSPMVSPSVTPTGSRVLLVAAFLKSGSGIAGGNTLPDMDIVAPATQLDWTGTIVTDDQGPTMVVGYRFIDNPSGSYTIGATADTAGFANGEWGCAIACFGII